MYNVYYVYTFNLTIINVFKCKLCFHFGIFGGGEGGVDEAGNALSLTTKFKTFYD